MNRDSAVDALRVAKNSSLQLARLARARYSTDILTWPFRAEFDALWNVVSRVPGWFNEASAAVFYAMMRERPPETVVEIGSYLGRSTVFFGLALERLNPAGRVVAVDPHTGDRQILEALGAEEIPSFELFQIHCRSANVERIVDARVATSMEVAVDWKDPVDLLFVDGWHSYEAVTEDGTAWLPHLSPRGTVVFDDYLTYDDVHRAVDDLDRHGLFHLWGSVFGQAIGGMTPAPPPAAARALRLAGGRRRS